MYLVKAGTFYGAVKEAFWFVLFLVLAVIAVVIVCCLVLFLISIFKACKGVKSDRDRDR